MEIKKEKCSHCNNLNYVIQSNNPLVKGICVNCINEVLDASRVEHFMFFCRTYNIPFSPNVYMVLYKQYQKMVFVKYIETLVDDGKLKYDDATGDIWAEVEREWSKVKDYTTIMLKIPTVRESFEERSKIKWGIEYTFGELIQLENLFINTIKTYNISDPMRLDAIKKACKLSVKIDSLIESGDAKSIKDYTAAYQSFLKAANIDEMAQTATEGSIKTVSDLYKYMEKNNFEFKFYDHEERDIVDKTINDIKKTIHDEISHATGLDFQIENIKRSMEEKIEEDVTKEVLSSTPLSDILGGAEDYYDTVEMETDKELETQEIDLEYFDEEV